MNIIVFFPDAFATAKKTYGQLDIVCNNAGIMHEGIWEKMVDINVVSWDATSRQRQNGRHFADAIFLNESVCILVHP